MHRIQQISRWMTIILTLAFLAMLLVGVTLILFPDLSIQQIYSSYNLSPNIPPLTTWQYGALALLAALNFLPTLFVIWKLRRMFQLFALGEVFSSAATGQLFGAAKGMVAWGIIAIFSTTAAVLILTANAAKGEHVLVANISTVQLAGIFAGVIFVVMSWVMQEAARLSEENAGFV